VNTNASNGSLTPAASIHQSVDSIPNSLFQKTSPITEIRNHEIHLLCHQIAPLPFAPAIVQRAEGTWGVFLHPRWEFYDGKRRLS
jgi:hypothetical protein